MESGIQVTILRLLGLPRPARKGLVIGLDLIICVLAVWAAYWLRLGEWEWFTSRVMIFAGIAVGTWGAIAGLCHFYRSVTRFAGRHTILILLRCCVLMAAILAALLFSLRIESVPRTLAVIHPLLLFLGVAGGRILIAGLVGDALRGLKRGSNRKRVLIYGAGLTGEQLARSISHEPGLHVVGFIDENKSLRGNRLEGKPIWHSCDLEVVFAAEKVDEVLLAIPSAMRTVRRSVVERIRGCNARVRVRVVPRMSEIASGRLSVSELREIQIEELLGRDEIPADAELMARNIVDQCVLVTGAGGSIGSELCRQILRERPKRLILAERSEHALYCIDIELRELLRRHRLETDLSAELVNVADSAECSHLLKKWRPDTVFHAAAYKHVPLIEDNPVAGIRNNVLGTFWMSLASEEAGVRKFILVSTDKAVRPTNVMGASKRVCEMIVQARAQAQDRTSYCSVRFGNVLGSSGSVIPRFKQQIADGGPVTITHRDATRYFMTIPEAAQLVIQAGSLAADGEILLLDMGEPVRILDLARLMIELSGLSVADDANRTGDVAIEEIGLRAGEKMQEELLIGGDCQGTAHPRIIKAREQMLTWDALELSLLNLIATLDHEDRIAAVRALKRLVPEYEASLDLGARPEAVAPSAPTVPAMAANSP